MAKERLSQVQKAILLVADEILWEFRKDAGSRVSYRLLVKRLAIKADRVHERSRCIDQAYLVTVSRSIRNMAEKGLVELHFSRRFRSITYYYNNLRFISLTGKGKQALKKLKLEGGWENNTWLKKSLEAGEERRKLIKEFFQKLFRSWPNLK